MDTLLLLEHPPVVTIGRGGRRDHLLVSREELSQAGISLFETSRGGDITYHGPGQLVGYPIMDFKRHGQNLHKYLRRLEAVLIRALGDHGVTSLSRLLGRPVLLEDVRGRVAERFAEIFDLSLEEASLGQLKATGSN